MTKIFPKLGLDIGDVRIGLATCDSSGLIASPLKTIKRSKDLALREIIKLVQEQGIAELVVGLPMGPSGEITGQAQKNINFITRLLKRTKVKVIFVDEAFSTCRAQELTVQAQTKPRATAEVEDIDARSAAVILQGYLDSPERVLDIKLEL